MTEDEDSGELESRMRRIKFSSSDGKGNVEKEERIEMEIRFKEVRKEESPLQAPAKQETNQAEPIDLGAKAEELGKSARKEIDSIAEEWKRTPQPLRDIYFGIAAAILLVTAIVSGAALFCNRSEDPKGSNAQQSSIDNKLSGINYNQKTVEEGLIINFGDKDYEGIINSYKENLKADENNSSACVFIAFRYLQMRKYDESIAYLKRAIKIDSQDATIYAYLGIAFEGKGSYDQAEAAHKKAISLSGDERAGYAVISNRYKELGIEDRARECDTKIKELNK